MNKKDSQVNFDDFDMSQDVEYTVREIAEALGMSHSSTDRLIKHAYQKFRRELIRRMIKQRDLL